MSISTITQHRLKELLHYDPAAGVFTWLVGGSHRGVGKKVAPKPNRHGYLRIQIDGELHYAHRLAWLYVHGSWPVHHTDHINGNCVDNRIANLRDAPAWMNGQNRHKPRKGSVLPGANRYRSRWYSRINVRGVIRSLGVFATAEEASAAYLEAKRQLHEGSTL